MSGLFLTLLTASGKTSALVSAVGVSASALLGNVVAETAEASDVSGVAAIGSVSSVAVLAGSIVSTTGVSGTAQTSAVLIDTASDALLQGVSASGQVSSAIVNASATATLTGVVATAAVGSTIAGEGTNVLVSGIAATGQVSSVTAQGNIAINTTGVSATASTNNVAVAGTALITTTGVAATGAVGSVAAQEEGLPEGTILLFDRSSVATPIPSGFSLYTEQDGQSISNFLIKGGSTVSRTTGSPAPVTRGVTSVTTSSAGAHQLTTGAGITFSGGLTSSRQYPANQSGGAHTHSITISPAPVTYPSSAVVQGMEVPLIRASATSAKVPANAIIFSSDGTVFTGFARKSWSVSNGLYKAASSINVSQSLPTSIAPSFSLTVSSDGAHLHPQTFISTAGNPSPVQTTFRFNVTSGAHVHTSSLGHLGVWHQYKHLLPVVATLDSDVQPGMIIMYNGVSVPPGWLLCDGTNGTPDMIDYFVGYDNSKNSSGDVVGRDVIGSTGPTDTTPGPSPTTYATTSVPISVATATNPHIHYTDGWQTTGSSQQQHPQGNAPHSHTSPSTTFSMPTAYIPQTLTLIFLQKAA